MSFPVWLSIKLATAKTNGLSDAIRMSQTINIGGKIVDSSGWTCGGLERNLCENNETQVRVRKKVFAFADSGKAIVVASEETIKAEFIVERNDEYSLSRSTI